MDNPSRHIRYCAVSMEVAACLDGPYVEMHLLTDTGKLIAIMCEKESLLAIQRHIEQMERACPEIATWTAGGNAEIQGGPDRTSAPTTYRKANRAGRDSARLPGRLSAPHGQAHE